MKASRMKDLDPMDLVTALACDIETFGELVKTNSDEETEEFRLRDYFQNLHCEIIEYKTVIAFLLNELDLEYPPSKELLDKMYAEKFFEKNRDMIESEQALLFIKKVTETLELMTEKSDDQVIH